MRLRDGLIVSVIVARSVRVWKDTVRWLIDPVGHERLDVTLLARLDLANRLFLDFHVLPDVDRPKRFQISRVDPWLLRGVRLEDVGGLLVAVQAARHGLR